MENYSSKNCDSNNLNKICESNHTNENEEFFSNINSIIDFFSQENNNNINNNQPIEQNSNIINEQIKSDANEKYFDLYNINNNDKIIFKKEPKKNNNDKIDTSLYEYKKKIEEYYDDIFKDDVKKFFIKSILEKHNSNLNKFFWKLFISFDKIEFLEPIYKEKLIKVICLLYYFARGNKSIINERILKSNLNLDENILKFFEKNFIIDFSKKRKKSVKQFIYNFYKDLYFDNSPEGNNLILSLYIFLIISRILKDSPEKKVKKYFEDILEKEYLISFKIHFILKYKQLFVPNYDFFEIYEELYFINKFYNEIFNGDHHNVRLVEDNKINKNKIKENRFIFSFYKITNYNIDNLFTIEDNTIYSEVINKICNFYSSDLNNINDMNDLIYDSTKKIGNKESNFILDIVEHIYQKRNFIFNNFSEYKKNLLNLEKQIFFLGKTSLSDDKNSKKLYKYSINDYQRLVFSSLINKINQNINNVFKGKFNLYPIGSVTQLLPSNNSDLDMYLDIRQINNQNEKIDFLFHLKNTLAKIIGETPNLYISKRLFVISFKYSYLNGKKTDFDISLTGFRSYIHSILFRTYSLIDPRFSLLAITLKKFLELCEVKNKQHFLNSFSWMILLITFLQDIIKPQILPKIFSDKNNSLICCKIHYPKINPINYNINSPQFYKLELFVKNFKEEKIFLPDSFFDKKSLFEIYKEQIKTDSKKLEKNNLSCAEIFLYFLEFIIFYFKNDSIYVNCSIESEAYESMQNISDDNFNNKNDKKFLDYFKSRYFKRKKYNDNNRMERDGIILIRDPVDPYNNPGHTLNSINFIFFIDNIKKGYLQLLKYGDLYKVNSDI